MELHSHELYLFENVKIAAHENIPENIYSYSLYIWACLLYFLGHTNKESIYITYIHRRTEEFM